MSSHPVQLESDDELSRRMQALGIREEDLEEQFVRSGGHGGQHVNKTASCVMLRHEPSGIQVKCQDSRRQGANRVQARWLLVRKMEEKRKEQAVAKRAAREKERRRKRPRSKAAKERMLKGKRQRSEKKARRKKVDRFGD